MVDYENGLPLMACNEYICSKLFFYHMRILRVAKFRKDWKASKLRRCIKENIEVSVGGDI